MAQGGNLQDALRIMEQAAGDAGVGLADMFGSVEAGSAALSLTGANAAGFNSNIGEMEKSAGATKTAYETMADSTTQDIASLTVAWEGLQLATGEYIASIGLYRS